MQGAGTVGTGFPIPPIAVPSNPEVEKACDPMNAGNKQDPGQKFPTAQPQTDLGPRLRAGVDAASPVNGLHRAHSHLPVNVGKSPCGARIVEVEQLDVPMAVERTNARDTGPAERAGSIKKHG